MNGFRSPRFPNILHDMPAATHRCKFQKAAYPSPCARALATRPAVKDPIYER